MTDHETSETIRLTADAVVLAAGNHVLLIQRGRPPHQGAWALPGGHVNPGETSRQACSRELEEETGIRVPASKLQQIGVFDQPDCDPRGRYVTIAYAVFVPDSTPVTAGDDANAARWWPLDNLPPLAFDHADIITTAVTPTP